MFPYFDDGKPGDYGYYEDCSPRKWRYWPVFKLSCDDLTIGIQTQLLMFKGKKYDKPSWVSGVELRILWNPFKWKLWDIFHAYCDGCLCSYQFGPFMLNNLRTWWCKTCCKELE